ncbi:MAG TPA: 4Fe-4S binding protein [Sumerlaeia bacterium]|nr:4Fe-4S binding protein [Sumerlaeia bacterium]
MSGRQTLLRACLVLLCLLPAIASTGVEYFSPPPDLGEGYTYPESYQAEPRAGWLAWVDTFALTVALTLAALIALRWRRRRAMVWLSVASLLYFGFYRKGCVCPIGAIQNVARALFDTTYVLPWVVLAFFAFPLLFALLFGRVFCSGVCPFGALQDLALLKPVRVPRWLDEGLSLLRYFYLGLAVFLAAMGAGYFICRYDPFVSFFRMSGRFHIWVWSGAVVLLSFFVGRPYCRYLCPYGALLGMLSRFAVKRATITPDRCVACGLCADACPFGAIREGEEDAQQ